MKLLLVIDVADDVAEAYEDFTVDYDLRGTPKEDESVKYIEDAKPKPLPRKRDIDKTLEFGGYENIIQESLARGYNVCLKEITK